MRILKISWANKSVEFGTQIKGEADFMAAPIAVNKLVDWQFIGISQRPTVCWSIGTIEANAFVVAVKQTDTKLFV